MSKKMMRRSLALGALMAFVITGSAMAATPVVNNATADQAIAIGSSQAAEVSIAIGRLNNASASSSVAIGVNNTSGGKHSVAMGYYSETKADNSVAIGKKAIANNVNSVALGNNAIASGNQGIAIGSVVTASGLSSVALGNTSNATGTFAVSMGYLSDSTGEASVAIGHDADATNVSATAIGRQAKATGDRGTAYGASAEASGLRSTALGYSAVATNDFDVAVGSHAETTNVVNVSSVEIGGKTYEFAGSVATGAVSFGGGGSSSLGVSDIKRQLQNVAAGQVNKDSTDAVNGSQLYAAYQAIDATQAASANNSAAIAGLNQRLGKTNAKINKVGAGAAALAALHPLDYDPDDKLTFSAGMGNYAGENAAALGAFYRPNEKFMLSLGGTMGNGENMVNLGLSIGLDKASGLAKLSKKELIQKVNAVEAENDALEDRVAKLEALIAQLAKK